MSGEKLLSLLLVCVLLAPFFTQAFFARVTRPFFEPKDMQELDRLRRKAYWFFVMVGWAGVLCKSLWAALIIGVVLVILSLISNFGRKS